MRRVHMNTAGAGPPAPGVREAMIAFLELEAQLGPYEAEAAHAADLTDRVYRQLTALVGAQPTEIALYGNGH